MKPLLRRTAISSGSALLIKLWLGQSLLCAAPFPQTPQSADETAPAASAESGVIIPGPRRSFLRMAGISQKASLEETLPLLAGEVRMRGYSRGKPTEYLVLLKRYLQQAQRLAALAGKEGVIKVPSCAEALPLLDVIGYRLRQPCGPKTSVQTAEPELAFLTIDSGFPLAQLEDALRQNKPFTLDYPSSTVPVLFTTTEWTGTSGGSLLDALLDNPALARLYSAMTRMDAETALFLRHSPGMPRLVRYSGVLDFYGSHIAIRSGHVLVPGGPGSDPAWKALVGASPDSAADFVSHLLSKDQGWLAAYFDAASYASPQQQDYFVQMGRLKRFYNAFRGSTPFSSATRPIFRPVPGLPLLMTRLVIDPNGQPHIPGDLEVWKEIFRDEAHRGSHQARPDQWASPEDFVDALFSRAREFASDSPLECFLTLSEIDRGRTQDQRLTPETARLLASKFSRYGDQYATFVEFHALTNESINEFIETAEKLDRIPSPIARANATGMFQAIIGLWEILARQQEIEPASQNESWKKIIAPFESANSGLQVFEAGKTSYKELLHAGDAKTASQEEIVGLLAGPVQSDPAAKQIRQQLALKIRSVLEAQRLVSIDTLLTLGDGMTELAQGNHTLVDSLLPLAGQLREFEMPRAIFTASERTEYTQQRSDVNHTTLQARTNFARIIKSGSPKELADAHGRLAAFLRDTLVGLNYAYYEPPGAQMLHNNAIFVRSHDYSEDVSRGAQPWRTPQLVNLGVTASGGAHLCGSLADLPYVLAVVEQDFIVPEAVQSLIWQDFVPSLLSASVLPRWWNVSREEMHAVGLYQRTGEELLTSAASDDNLRQSVLAILAERVLPQRLSHIEEALRAGRPQRALAEVTPSDMFFVTAEFRRRFPEDAGQWKGAGKELDDLIRSHPEETNWLRLSQDFGAPHPALAHSNGRELVNMKLFPVYLHYSSRLLAESWDSNNLYWARLADELGYEPASLNQLVPELTRRMVEKLFATSLDDWPAVLRATRETGEEFRAGKIASGPKKSLAVN